MSNLSNSQSLTAGSAPKLHGIVFDRSSGATRGFVNGIWVPPQNRIRTHGVHKGALRILDDRHLYQAGMNVGPKGIANGDARPVAKMGTESEESWSALRFTQKTRDVWARLPKWLRPDVVNATMEAAAREASRRRAARHERQAAKVINTSLDRQRERAILTPIFGSDGAGTGAEFPFLDLSGIVDMPGAGMLWSDPKFPLVEWLMWALDKLQDESGKTVFDLLIGTETARHWSKNLQMQGVHLIDGGDSAAGYSLAALMKAPRLTQPALTGRLQGNDAVGRLGRVVIGGARADHGPGSGAKDLRYMQPDACHFCHFGEPDLEFITDDGDSEILTSATGMIEIDADQVPLTFWHRDHNEYGWYADDWRGWKAVLTDHGATYRNA